MPMLSQFQMNFRSFLVLASKVWTCICYMFNRQVRSAPDGVREAAHRLQTSGYQLRVVARSVHDHLWRFRGESACADGTHEGAELARLARLKHAYLQFVQHQPVKYQLFPLSPVSRSRLSMVQRKTLVLDLDETLIHSHHDAMPRNMVKPGTPHDFTVKVTIDRHPVRFFVHKRPHVDYFLDIVSQWYDLVVFTASMEIYGAAVADKLDNGRNILRRRYYRQHCTPDFGSYTKDLSAICSDLNRIFIIDNSPGAYRCFPNNAIPIKSWFSDPMDICLLSLLPMLDALRFTNDVRSVLSRNLHLHRLW